MATTLVATNETVNIVAVDSASRPGYARVVQTSLEKRIELVLAKTGWSQRELSRRAGLGETHVGLILRAAKKNPTHSVELKTLQGIAAAAGVSLAWLSSGQGSPELDGDTPSPSSPEIRVEREDEHVPEDDEVPLESALFAVFAADRRGARKYTTADFDAARAAIRASHRKTHPDAALDAHATRLLDAARQLRAEGIPTDATNLLSRAAVGKTERAAEVTREVSDAYNAEIDAELLAKGLVPGAGRADLEAMRAAKKARKGTGVR